MSAFLLRASSAHRWVNCFGSAMLEAAYPDDESPSAREGTAAHWAATEPLLGRSVAVGDVAPNGVTITAEMIEAGELFRDAVHARIPVDRQQVEKTLPAPSIHALCGGTADTNGLGFPEWVLHVIDYKFGHGFVDAFEMWQGIVYLSSAFDDLVARGLLFPLDELGLRFEITVVQPRNYHPDGPVRSWRGTWRDLRTYLDQLIYAAERAMQPDAPLITGPWCEHCTAAHACPALQQAGYTVAAHAAGPIPHDLTPVQTGVELHWLHKARELLEARIEGLEVSAENLIRRGESVPYFAVESKPGNLVWKEEEKANVIVVGAALGFDLAKPAEPITPTQAKKLKNSEGATIDEAVINEYAHRPRGAAKLVSVDLTQTRKIFGANSQ